jgi:F-box/leucine-rich repeat protein 2/20
MFSDHVDLEDAVPSSKDKGKGKAIDVPSSSGLSHSSSFLFDFELNDVTDTDFEADSSHKNGYGNIQEVHFKSPEVRLLQYGKGTQVYAGPSSREEEFTTPFGSIPMFPSPESYASSSMPATPPNGLALSTRAPKHRRSVSSLSLRSIRSSSSRSIASIRSALTGENIRGKMK